MIQRTGKTNSRRLRNGLAGAAALLAQEHDMTTTAGEPRSIPARALHLLDLENLVGGNVTAATVHAVWTRYERTVTLAGKTTSSSLSPSATRRPRPSTCPPACGASSARTLPTAPTSSCPKHAAHRYSRGYLGSCDGYLTGLARLFGTLGCPVTQLVGNARVSATLYIACQNSVRLAPKSPRIDPSTDPPSG